MLFKEKSDYKQGWDCYQNSEYDTWSRLNDESCWAEIEELKGNDATQSQDRVTF